MQSFHFSAPWYPAPNGTSMDQLVYGESAFLPCRIWSQPEVNIMTNFRDSRLVPRLLGPAGFYSISLTHLRNFRNKILC